MKVELNSTSKDHSELIPLADTAYEQIFRVYKDNDIFYAFNILKTIHIPKDIHEDMYHYVRLSGKTSWVGLSMEMYGTIKLWWLICIVNKINNPVQFPTPGMRVRVIKKDLVGQILKQIKESK